MRTRPLAWATFLLLAGSPLAAQSTPPGTRHVQWPLLDLVMVPDSSGVWLVVGPTPATEQWQSSSDLVDLSADPIVTLQWATVARQLASGGARVTPRLSARRSSEFVLLGRNEKRSIERAFVFVASDSAARIRWKAFASAGQVDTFLTALEQTAMATRQMFDSAGEPDPDTPVSIVSVPSPKYPAELATRGRIGRVWMTYVVGPDGRARPESFRQLLSDHPLFTRAAVVALLQGRFKPARSQGKPVSQRVCQAIVFRIS